ncbi:hypothetical protein ACTQ5R_08405 [Ruoffia tabacinasalis]
MHFKEVDQKKCKEIMDREIQFFDACGENVMVPIGDGNVDYPAIDD